MSHSKLLFAFLFLAALAGCSSVHDVVASNTSMVTICANTGMTQGVLEAAQAECQKYGKNAELINETDALCTPTKTGSLTPSHSVHFRCVNP